MSRLARPELAERRRRQILDAALDCFRRRGFHQTSMQEICAAAGISAGALYRYFGSKAEIITAITKPGTNKTNPVAGDVRSNFASSGEGIQLKYGPYKGRLIQRMAAALERPCTCGP